jgi:hypothetical protein
VVNPSARGSDMYLFYFYNEITLPLYFAQLQHKYYSFHERLHLVKLDDYSILQRDHLVKNKPNPECMICSGFKTSVSHGSDSSRVRLIGHMTNEHLACLDLNENPSSLKDSITPVPRVGQGFDYLVG